LGLRLPSWTLPLLSYGALKKSTPRASSIKEEQEHLFPQGWCAAQMGKCMSGGSLASLWSCTIDIMINQSASPKKMSNWMEGEHECIKPCETVTICTLKAAGQGNQKAGVHFLLPSVLTSCLKAGQRKM
jgi:hypothetical protein